MKRLYIKTARRYVLVDDDDYELAKSLKWAITKDGYAISHQYVFLHKLVLNAPKGQIVDHIDGNPFDCRKSNLRFCTPRENCLNRRPNRNKAVKYKGVGKRAGRQNPFTASITVDNRNTKVIIGYFTTARQAALAYDLWAIDLHGQFAKTNFLPAGFGPKKS